MRGFSLVELSIVLVILGLLTGGILAGQNLIRAAELRAVTTEYDRYVAATHTFRDKYFAIPGDMNNAEAFWDAPASCPGTAGTGTQTCDGNGDGNVGLAAAVSQYGEVYTFWQHLANAGLIEGSYTGITGAGGVAESLVENSPRSKFSQGLWFASTANGVAGNASVLAGNYGGYLFVGTPLAANAPIDPLFTPEEAWNIDTKMDDGRPGQGNVWAYWWDTCSDATSQTDYSGEYLLTLTSKECALYFRNAF